MTMQGTPELLATLKIEPEFRDKIPPLTEAEFQQLRENIMEAGEVYEPIRVWNGVVVDGHNRLKVIEEHPEIKWSAREMDFVDKWAAFDWMYRNQLGRRNLTDEQRTYMIGKMYEARKNSHGNNAERGEDGKYLSAQNGHLGERRVRQDEVIGKELGIGHNTVRRAEKFAKGVDTLKQVSQEAADKVLMGKSKATKAQISTLGDLASESSEQAALEAPSVAKAIQMDEALPAITQPFKREKRKKAERPTETTTSSSASTEQYWNDPSKSDSRGSGKRPENPYDFAPTKYSLDSLVEEIVENGEDYISVLQRHIDVMFPQFGDIDGASDRVRAAIDGVIAGLKAITIGKEDLHNGADEHSGH